MQGPQKQPATATPEEVYEPGLDEVPARVPRTTGFKRLTAGDDARELFRALWLPLEDAGVTVVTAKFEGGGDEGYLEERELLSAPVDGKRLRLSDSVLAPDVIRELEDALTQLADSSPADWVNNEGGCVVFEVWVRERKIFEVASIYERELTEYGRRVLSFSEGRANGK